MALSKLAAIALTCTHGVMGNPQGNSEPAATTRIYDPKTKTYESDSAYEKRITNDLKKNIETFKENGIRAPRVMVWPYGRYNLETVRIAKNWACQLPLL